MSLRPLMLHRISTPQSSYAGTVQSPAAIEIGHVSRVGLSLPVRVNRRLLEPQPSSQRR